MANSQAQTGGAYRALTDLYRDLIAEGMSPAEANDYIESAPFGSLPGEDEEREPYARDALIDALDETPAEREESLWYAGWFTCADRASEDGKDICWAPGPQVECRRETCPRYGPEAVEKAGVCGICSAVSGDDTECGACPNRPVDYRPAPAIAEMNPCVGCIIADSECLSLRPQCAYNGFDGDAFDRYAEERETPRSGNGWFSSRDLAGLPEDVYEEDY